MEQLEDLSKIIRDKDTEIDELQQKIADKEGENREIHMKMQKVREECAQLNANKGMDMLMGSSMKQKMLDDPRFQRMVTEKEGKSDPGPQK